MGLIPDHSLFTDRIVNILESVQCADHSKKIYDDIKELFISFDKGSQIPDVAEFNGKLFSGVIPETVYFSDLKDPDFFKEVKQHSQFKSLKLNDREQRVVEKYNNLNPIITNLLIMDSFDFNTEINVNILGHIFEQSISDLEDLRNQTTSKKKKMVCIIHQNILQIIYVITR